MQWDASPNAAFTDGSAWISPAENYPQINAEQALADPDSVFYTYQQLIQLRKSLPILTLGDYQDQLPEHPYLWCYQRNWQGQKLVVWCNLSAESQQVPLTPPAGEWLLGNYQDAPNHSSLRPFEAVYWLV